MHLERMKLRKCTPEAIKYGPLIMFVMWLLEGIF